jgi:hypothetical protein
MVVRAENRFQFASVNALADLLNACLRDPAYKRFRFFVAFARWSGLFLVDAELQQFAQRRGTSIHGYVGVDLGGTTIEALTYLHELPSSSIHVVEAQMTGVVVHPKVYEFSGKDRWVTIIGSSNLTTGGLFANVETSVVLTGSAKDPLPSEAMFERLRPRSPFTTDHVRSVTEAVLAELAPRLARYSRPSPDSGGRGADGSAPLMPGLVLPNPGRPPSPASSTVGKTRTPRRARQPVRTSAQAPSTNDLLFVELWDETRNGTQVQLPRRVFSEYFGAAVDAVAWITVHDARKNTHAIRLQGFPNSTFRISLPFVGVSSSGAGRRAVLRFERIAQDEYRVGMRRKGESGYPKWLAACTEQTTSASKRFGIVLAAEKPPAKR